MDKWILVSDSLPDDKYKNEHVLVAFLGWDDVIYQKVAEYDGENWYDWEVVKIDKVIAWQPLPDVVNLKGC